LCKNGFRSAACDLESSSFQVEFHKIDCTSCLFRTVCGAAAVEQSLKKQAAKMSDSPLRN